MNKPDTKLHECIYVAEKIIPADICDVIVKDIESREWIPHKWYNVHKDSYHSEEKMELDIQGATLELQKQLGKFIIEAGRKYEKNYAFFTFGDGSPNVMNNFCQVRFNRYSPGQIMRQHFDHIHSLFDGTQKGVPVLSFIMNFNDDYEGADLYFWKDNVIKLGKGDIVMFPSNFFFPHGVTEATKGKRYSGVSWAW